MGRTVDCGAVARRGRLRKAEQFHQAALTVGALADDATDVADACVTLLVHAGIAAADVICCARLGKHAQGESHNEAVALLKSALAGSAKDLDTLLKVKTKAGYSHLPVSRDDRTKVERACARLIEAARAES